MKTMNAVAVLEAGKVAIVKDVPIPEVGDYEALIKVHACGFCNGTDFQIINGTLETGFGGYPTILGHEGAGEVVEIGKKVRDIKIGERFIHPNLRPNVGNGYTKTHGSMAQYGLVNDDKAMLEDGFKQSDLPFPKQHKFPKSISYVDAAQLLSLAECHSAALNFCTVKNQDVLIYGAGPMGIALSMFIKLLCDTKSVIQIDSVDERLEHAKHISKVDQIINFAKENVDEVLNGQKFDIIIDAVGFSNIIYEGSARLKPGGKVGSLGVLKRDDRIIDTSRLQCNTSLHMLNFPYGEYAIMDETISLIEKGLINPKDFYSHIVPYKQIDKVLELVKDKKALKVIITFDD